MSVVIPLRSSTPPRWAPLQTRAFGLVWSLLLPAGVVLAALRFLIPSRMEGGATGLFASLARAGDEHPLLLALVLFLSLSEAAKYWLRRMRGHLAAEAPAPPPPLVQRFERTLRFALVLAAVAAVALGARATVAEVHRVVGASMAPTLNGGDRLLVNRLAYGVRLPFSKRVLGAKPPRRGDLIVFANPHDDDGRDGRGAGPRSLVKRVIGLPGDVIAFRDGAPIVNGWVVPSCDAGPFLVAAGTSLVRGRLAVEVLEDRAYLTVRTPIDDSRFARFEVPAGEVFVLGDDRGVSDDSRSWNEGRGGGVRIDSIEGRVSRFALAASRDGRVDLRHPLAPLRPALRETQVDVSGVERRISTCLAHMPAVTRPPLPPRETETGARR